MCKKQKSFNSLYRCRHGSASISFLSPAFSFIELILVIIIIGIFSTLSLISFSRNYLDEAIVHLESDLRYTQRLALSDNRFNPENPLWYKSNWQLVFTKSKKIDGSRETIWGYTIFSDRNYDKKINKSEVATNPSDNTKLMTYGITSMHTLKEYEITRRLGLAKYYHITNVIFSKTCTNPRGRKSRRMIFDNYGKPYWSYDEKKYRIQQSKYFKPVKEECMITLKEGKQSRSLCITPYSGYIRQCNSD